VEAHGLFLRRLIRTFIFREFFRKLFSPLGNGAVAGLSQQSRGTRPPFDSAKIIRKKLRAQSIEDGTQAIKKVARRRLTCRSNSR